MLLGVALLAHVVCFAVLTMEVDRRYQNAESVSQMAELLASSQQASLRAYFMQVGAVHSSVFLCVAVMMLMTAAQAGQRSKFAVAVAPLLQRNTTLTSTRLVLCAAAAEVLDGRVPEHGGM